jgi:DNA sulfur modification protein DndC
MQFELMTRLLSTERSFQTMSRRVGVIDALEKHFKTSSRPQAEAIDHARHTWDMKQAAQDGDVDTMKQLTWAAMKFGNQESTL